MAWEMMTSEIKMKERRNPEKAITEITGYEHLALRSSRHLVFPGHMSIPCLWSYLLIIMTRTGMKRKETLHSRLAIPYPSYLHWWKRHDTG